MRAEFLPWAKEFIKMGYTFVGTPGTAEYYCKHDVRKLIFKSSCVAFLVCELIEITEPDKDIEN